MDCIRSGAPARANMAGGCLRGFAPDFRNSGALAWEKKSSVAGVQFDVLALACFA